MVYGKRVDGLIFLMPKRKILWSSWSLNEQFPFLILGKSISPFIPLVDNDNVQAVLMRPNISSKKDVNEIAFHRRC